MSECPVVSHFRSTDLIQPLKQQPETVHFKGVFPPRKFKSNPDLVALKAVEQNRFDRIPSPPVCGPEVMLMNRKMEKLNPREEKVVAKTRLYLRPSSLEMGDGKGNRKRKLVPENEIDEIGQLCQGFSNQLSLLK
ncbi:uncharacterized protein LOC131688801 [Topomyia yanbarensis]|uniref:uncharacterized protein LOC131688801 n=1 Tax=Topomyia yanbarensis TaxID=2498891 RepID=UPI00273AF83D|nr:uncharacterized protein LOC131688801 [Topomyia yanbarensis]